MPIFELSHTWGKRQIGLGNTNLNRCSKTDLYVVSQSKSFVHVGFKNAILVLGNELIARLDICSVSTCTKYLTWLRGRSIPIIAPNVTKGVENSESIYIQFIFGCSMLFNVSISRLLYSTMTDVNGCGIQWLLCNDYTFFACTQLKFIAPGRNFINYQAGCPLCPTLLVTCPSIGRIGV